MKSRFTWFGMVVAAIIVIGICLGGCKNDVSAVVTYVGKVVYKGTTTPFPYLEVKVTNGDKIHAIEHTDENGDFSLNVKVDEIDGGYYVLVGDSSCVTRRMDLSGYGQSQVNLGTIEIEGPSLPTVSTKTISNYTDNSAVCGGNVTSDGRSKVTARGVCWSKSEYPTLDDEHTVNGSGLGEFNSQITHLDAGETYYVRAYATNKQGTAYGEQRSFATATGLPQVTTDDVNDISATSAKCGGSVAANSGYAITARGICWSSTTASPTMQDSHTEEVATTGHFTSMMIGLERNTTYYVRAYAVNEKGTNYGETKKFTTLNGFPVVTTAEITEIKSTTALGGGNVVDNGGFPITARGLCWSSSSSTPAIDDNHTNEVADKGMFTSLMTGLEPNTNYYVRAYATNDIGTSYGESVLFMSADGLPEVETLDPGENITSSSISAVGNVIDNGGSQIIERGVVYSTLPYPTVQNAKKVSSGYGTGYFTAYITNISPSSNTYYIRAYAINSYGTAYGEQIVITPEHSEYLSLQKMIYAGYTYRIKYLGQMTWTEGKNACENMVYDGYSDWFMPDEGEVQNILTIDGVWNKTITTRSNNTLLIYGCDEFWTSKESGSTTAYCYSIIDDGTYEYNPSTGKSTEKFLWSWQQDSSNRNNTKGVFAVRKYHSNN